MEIGPCSKMVRCDRIGLDLMVGIICGYKMSLAHKKVSLVLLATWYNRIRFLRFIADINCAKLLL